MAPFIGLLNEEKKRLGCMTEIALIHCNTHVETSLASGLNNVLMEIEAYLGKS